MSRRLNMYTGYQTNHRAAHRGSHDRRPELETGPLADGRLACISVTTSNEEESVYTMSPTIYTLPAIAQSAGDQASLTDQIEKALLGTGKVTVPGETEEDKKWAFKRSVPTVVLYTEQGLR